MRKCVHAPDAQQVARHRRAHGDQHAFGQQLADEAGAARAQRQPHRDLLAPVRRARQHHVRHVGAGDQQHHATQHQEELPEERQIPFADGYHLAGLQQRHAAAFLVSAFIAVRLLQLLRDGIQLGLRGGLCDARPQAPFHLKHGQVAAFQRVVRQLRRQARVHRRRQPQVRAEQRRRGAQKRLRPHAEDSTRIPIDPQ